MRRGDQVGNREGGSVVVDRVDEWIVDEHVDVERGWGARWRWRDDRWDLEVVEDLAGDARTGDERVDAQTVTAVGADENIDAMDAMDAAEEGGPVEAGWAASGRRVRRSTANSDAGDT